MKLNKLSSSSKYKTWAIFWSTGLPLKLFLKREAYLMKLYMYRYSTCTVLTAVARLCHRCNVVGPPTNVSIPLEGARYKIIQYLFFIFFI